MADPTFALIAAHQRQVAFTETQHEDADVDAAADLQSEAWLNLIDAVPSTLEGEKALALYVAEHADHESETRWTDDGEPQTFNAASIVLRRIATNLKTDGAQPKADRIFVLIEAHRKLAQEADACEDDNTLNTLGELASAAWRDLLDEVPTSRDTAIALGEYVVSAAFRSTTEPDADSADTELDPDTVDDVNDIGGIAVALCRILQFLRS